MFKIGVIFILLAAVMVGGWSCESESVVGCMNPNGINYNPNATKDNNSCVFPRSVTQRELTEARSIYKSNLTGPAKDNAGNTIPFSCFSGDPNNTIREIYSSYGLQGAQIGPGLMVVVHTFEKTLQGGKGKRIGVYAMLKQVNTYFPLGKDWEYMSIDPATVATGTAPNGVLPAENSASRGKLNNCTSCHSRDNNGLITF